MTTLDNPVTRLTREVDHRTGKPMVVRLEEGGRLVRIKTKGSHKWYTVTYNQLWIMGARNKAAELKAEKLAKRKAKKHLQGA